MKPAFLFPLLALCCHLAISQQELPYGNPDQADLPDWARLMYMEHPNPDHVIAAYQSEYKSKPFIKNQHTQFYKRWKRNLSRGLGPKQNAKAYLKAAAELKNHSRASSTWTSIGPFDWDHTAASRSNTPGAAHIYTVEQSVFNTDILYAGGATCGIWKSVNHGLSWFPTTDHLLANEVQTLEISFSDPNIVYAGMMEGIWKTMDGGNSWLMTGDSLFNTVSYAVKDIRINPVDENIIFFASSKGLYRSSDGGNLWDQIMTGNFLEIEFQPLNSDVVYAVKQNIFKTEFYKSTDGGLSFVQKSNGWPLPNQAQNEEQNRTEIAVSPADSSLVVALTAGKINGGEGLFGIYVSNDAGENWIFQCCGTQPGGLPSDTNKNILGYSQSGTSGGGQYYYDLALDISPTHTDSIFAAGINLWISEDGGADFVCPANWDDPEENGYIHADIHEVHFNSASKEIWIACDGGIFFSEDNGLSFSRRMVGISGTDFHGFDAGFWDGDVMIGGVFHNSTMLRDNQVYQNDWLCTDNTGDGLRGFVNFGNDRTVFSDIDIKVLPGDRNSPIPTSPFEHIPNATTTTGESSKIAFHPWCYQTWYSGEDGTLWRTSDHGKTFAAIHNFGENIADIEISWANPNYLYVSTFPGIFNNKKIYKSIDGGYNWEEITIPQSQLVGNFWAAYDLTLDSEDPLKIWVTRVSPLNNFSFDGYLVYSSLDGGNSWVNITTPALDGELPTNIVHQVGTDGGVYLGTRRAVYYRNESMSDWQLYNLGLPLSTFSTKLVPYYKGGKIRNATNRSVWETGFFEQSQPRAMASADVLELDCMNDSIQFVDHSVLNGENASWFWEFPNGSPATSSIRNPKVTFHSPGGQTVILTVSDDFGSDTRVFHDFILIKDDCGADTLAGMALKTNASPQYVQLPNFGLTLDTFSMSAWIRPNSIQSNFTAILMNDGVSAGLHFHKGNNTLGYHWPGGDFNWDSGLVVPTNEWSHVGMVVTPEHVTLYLNGDSAVHSTTLNPATLSSLKIGSFKGQATRNFKGAMDEVAIWSRTLSFEEIRLKRHLTRYIEQEEDLIAYYQFNQDGASVIDRVNSLHGTMNGSATKVISKAPVGGGKSDLIYVGSGGARTFEGTGLTIGFSNSGLYPNGDVVVTRINSLPVDVPTDKIGLTNGYWVVNNYGSPFISYFNSISITNAGFFSSAMAGDSNTANLYSRPDGSDGAWTLRINQDITIPNALDATIQYTDPGNTNQLEQWVVVRDPFPMQESEISIKHPSEGSNLSAGGESVLPAILGNDISILLPSLRDSQLVQIPSPAEGAIAYGQERKTIVYFDGTTWQNITAIPIQVQINGANPDLGSLIICNDSISSPNVALHLQGALGYILPGRMTNSFLKQISYPSSGMIMYHTVSQKLQCFDGARWAPFSSYSEGDGFNPSEPISSVPGFTMGGTTKDPNALLEINTENQALMVPSAHPEMIPSPLEGMLIYDSTRKAFLIFDGINWKRLL